MMNFSNNYSDFKILGELYVPTKEEIDSHKFDIFENSLQDLQILIRPISSLPKDFTRASYFNGFASQISSYSRPANAGAAIDKLHDKFKHCFVIFNGFKKKTNKKEDVFNVNFLLEFIDKPSDYEKFETFVSVPVFTKSVFCKTKKEFEDKLLKQDCLGDCSAFTEDVATKFIVWSDGDGITFYGPFETKKKSESGFSFSSRKKICSYGFQDNWADACVMPVNHPVLFLPERLADSLSASLSDKKNILINSEPSKPDNIISAKTSLQEVPATISPMHNTKSNTNFTELDFLSRLNSLALYQNLIYENSDLINFHTSIKSSNLTILAGMSGTGKSRLVKVYADALGLSEKQVKIIPVKPSWTDDSDILGYLDMNKMYYQPADTELVDVLFQAEKHPDKIFIICFDEMNLARVEHYFSQFLSVLEKDNGNKYLQLYNSSLEESVNNHAMYPSKINLGDNIFFIGTVNLDESTFHFSDKVLDRSNVINLHMGSFSALKAGLIAKKPEAEKIISFNEYLSFRNIDQTFSLSNREIEFLSELHGALHKENHSFGIGFRIVKQIDTYMKNLLETAEFTKQDAFDIQILQRIMTKVRGSEDQLNHLVGLYNNNESLPSNSILLKILEKYKDLSPFTKTSNAIFLKARELKLYGYTV